MPEPKWVDAELQAAWDALVAEFGAEHVTDVTGWDEEPWWHHRPTEFRPAGGTSTVLEPPTTNQKEIDAA